MYPHSALVSLDWLWDNPNTYGCAWSMFQICPVLWKKIWFREFSEHLLTSGLLLFLTSFQCVYNLMHSIVVDSIEIFYTPMLVFCTLYWNTLFVLARKTKCTQEWFGKLGLHRVNEWVRIFSVNWIILFCVGVICIFYFGCIHIHIYTTCIHIYSYTIYTTCSHRLL